MPTDPQRLAAQLIGATPDGLSEHETIHAAFRIACSQLTNLKPELAEAKRLLEAGVFTIDGEVVDTKRWRAIHQKAAEESLLRQRIETELATVTEERDNVRRMWGIRMVRLEGILDGDEVSGNEPDGIQEAVEKIVALRQQFATVTAEHECDADTIDKLRIRADKAEDERDELKALYDNSSKLLDHALAERDELKDTTKIMADVAFARDRRIAALEAVVDRLQEMGCLKSPHTPCSKTGQEDGDWCVICYALSALPKNQPAEGCGS